MLLNHYLKSSFNTFVFPSCSAVTSASADIFNHCENESAHVVRRTRWLGHEDRHLFRWQNNGIITLQVLIYPEGRRLSAVSPQRPSLTIRWLSGDWTPSNPFGECPAIVATSFESAVIVEIRTESACQTQEGELNVFSEELSHFPLRRELLWRS